MQPLVRTVAEALFEAGIDLEKLGLAWVRVAPTIALVPAFGLKALPTSARAVLGLALAAVIFPAVKPLPPGASPWLLAALLEVIRGMPVALACAIPLWAATMTGGVIDALRGMTESGSAPTVEGRPTPLGIFFSMLACTLFLVSGGASRAVLALAQRPMAAHPLEAAAHDLAAGIGLALALATPIIAAAIVIEIGAALVARAASPAQIHALLAPMRSLGLLLVTALAMDRIAGALTLALASAP